MTGGRHALCRNPGRRQSRKNGLRTLLREQKVRTRIPYIVRVSVHRHRRRTELLQYLRDRCNRRLRVRIERGATRFERKAVEQEGLRTRLASWRTRLQRPNEISH